MNGWRDEEELIHAVLVSASFDSLEDVRCVKDE